MVHGYFLTLPECQIFPERAVSRCPSISSLKSILHDTAYH